MPTINVKPDSHELLQELANYIEKSRKVIVITGAGISTNLGIPDFRSENGLYSLIQEQYDKVNAIQAQKNLEKAADLEAPRKRRRLSRTQSLGGTPDDADTKLAISRRSLRSSKSMGFAEDLPTLDDEAPQQSTVGLLRYNTPSVPTFLPQAPTNLLSNVKGKDLFDATIWKDKKSTQTHYTFITSLKHKIDEVQDTSEVHKFIRVLRDGGRLVRNYTQNIDMLEKREGLCTDLSRGVGSKGRFNPKLRKESREGQNHEGGKFDNGVEVVQLHGNLEYLRCTLCLKLCDWEEDDRHLTMLSGEAPPCPHCIKKTETRQEKGRRGLSVGTLRPDIVLYGENNPHDAAIGDVSTHDIKIGPDMCIILGTSLKVHGLKLLLREFSKAVHDRGGKVIFVNNTKPSDSIWGDVIDYWVEWDCDAWVRDVKARREGIWVPQGPSPETTPRLQHKQLPEGLPKPQPPKLQNGRKAQLPIPKHPQCMRIDYFCGAYIMDKIHRILRAQSGRGEDGGDTKAIQARIEQINHKLMRSGKAAEKSALTAADAALEAIKEARRERTRTRRAEKRALDREAAKELEEEANDEAAAAQLQLEFELPALSKLPNMWTITEQFMRKITLNPEWNSSHPVQPNSPEIHQLLEEQGWTYPSERDAARTQRLADLLEEHERPAGARAPTRLESQAILFSDGDVPGKRKRERLSVSLPHPIRASEQSLMPLSSPASLASDKSNMAYITWNILGIVSQEVGRGRALPETNAGQRTLFAELGREFTELPPPPTPAAAYALRNWSISSPRLSMLAAQNLSSAFPTSASSFGSQTLNGSNPDHIRSVLDLEHSLGMVPRYPRMGSLGQPPHGTPNTTHAVRYMSAAQTSSVIENDASLATTEQQLTADAGMASSPCSAFPAAFSLTAPVLTSSSSSPALRSLRANVPSDTQNNAALSKRIEVQMATPNPHMRMDDPLASKQDSTTSPGILFPISCGDFRKIERMINRCRFGLSLAKVCTCGLKALAEEEKGAGRWSLTSFGAENAARWLHLHDYRRDAIALLTSSMDISMARRFVRKVAMKECQDVGHYEACFDQPVIIQRSSSSPASVIRGIQECPATTNPGNRCICQIQGCISQWLIEGNLLNLNEWGAIQLSTLLHKTEYNQLAIKMVSDEEPDLVNYRDVFASILGMTLDEDEFKCCYQAGRAAVYTRSHQRLGPHATVSPVESSDGTPAKERQSPVATDEPNSSRNYAAPTPPIPASLSARVPPQTNIANLPSTPQSMAHFSMAPFSHLSDKTYVPPDDITRPAQFGMTPTPTPFNMQFGQLPTPASALPTAVELRKASVKLQRERVEHRNAINIQERAWTTLEHRHDERKEKRIAELEYQLHRAGQEPKRFLTPPGSDETSQSGSQYEGSQPSVPGSTVSVNYQSSRAEQMASGSPIVDKGLLATKKEMKPALTPRGKRIKSMGSIETILSSPPPAPPTLSRETEKLMDDEIMADLDRGEYSKLHTQDAKDLEEEHPAGEKRKRSVAKRKRPATTCKEPVAKKKLSQRTRARLQKS